MENSKPCSTCKQNKTLEQFSPSKNGKDGLRSNCKACNALVTRAYRAKNPKYASEYSKKYRQLNPERVKSNNKKFREENPDYAKQYHAKNQNSENLRGRQRYWKEPAKQALRKKLARQSNPEIFKLRNRQYALNNKDKLNEKASRRRARLANTQVYKITKKELWHLYNSKCFYCDKASETIEHLIPVSRGGNHGIGNMVPCCGSCNFSKGAKTVMEWRIWKKRLGLD